MKTSWDASDERLRGKLKGKPWTLCVGAGICSGIMPNWDDLACQVLSRTLFPGMTPSSFQALRKDFPWPAEAWIQVAYNSHIANSNSHEEFHRVLSDAIYSSIFSEATAHGCLDDLTNALHAPQDLSATSLERVCNFFESLYSDTTVILVAKMLTDSVKNGNPPTAVITLNYDTLLFSLQRIFEIRGYRRDSGTNDNCPSTFRQVSSSLQNKPGKIPIYHIHGCLPPNAVARTGSVVAEERSYFGLSQSSSSWAQTTFTHSAQTSTLLFVGQSLSDANMRRWLGWEHERLSEERRYAGRNALTTLPSILSPSHWWIHRGPGEAVHQDLLSKGMLHLGVNVAWVREWTEIDRAMRNMIGLAQLATS